MGYLTLHREDTKYPFHKVRTAIKASHADMKIVSFDPETNGVKA